MSSANSRHTYNHDHTAVVVVQPAGPTQSTGDVPVDDLIPCCGGCCFITSCYTEFPDCCGAVSEQTCLCINPKLIMCKKSKEPDACCKCCLLDCDVIPVTTCCKVSISLVMVKTNYIYNHIYGRQEVRFVVWMHVRRCRHRMISHVSSISALLRYVKMFCYLITTKQFIGSLAFPGLLSLSMSDMFVLFFHQRNRVKSMIS